METMKGWGREKEMKMGEISKGRREIEWREGGRRGGGGGGGGGRKVDAEYVLH